MKKFKVQTPIGNVVVSKEIMDEKELREFVKDFVQEEKSRETWLEKAKNDPIDDLAEWLRMAGYNIEEVK
jgi:hypothetical protein